MRPARDRSLAVPTLLPLLHHQVEHRLLDVALRRQVHMAVEPRFLDPLLRLVPPDVPVVAGMKAPPLGGRPESYLLITRTDMSASRARSSAMACRARW